VDLGDYPGLVPGIALSLILGFALCVPVARALGMASLNAWLLLFGFGLVIGATLTPSLQAITDGAIGTGTCDLSRVTLPSLDEVLAFGDIGLNVLLFVPLGLAVGFLPRRSHQPELIVLAAALPFVVEGTQLVITQLDRACESGDVVDDLVGLAIGLVVGLVAGGLMRAIRRLIAPAESSAASHD
jgi:hypothetical protein